MKKMAILVNLLAILFLGFVGPLAYPVSTMQVSRALTEIDRAQGFNLEKLKAMGRPELADPRSPEFADYLTGASKGPMDVLLVGGILVAALNILFLLVVGHREKKSPEPAPAVE